MNNQDIVLDRQATASLLQDLFCNKEKTTAVNDKVEFVRTVKDNCVTYSFPWYELKL